MFLVGRVLQAEMSHHLYSFLINYPVILISTISKAHHTLSFKIQPLELKISIENQLLLTYQLKFLWMFLFLGVRETWVRQFCD